MVPESFSYHRWPIFSNSPVRAMVNSDIAGDQRSEHRKALFELGVFWLLNKEHQDSKENPSSIDLALSQEDFRHVVIALVETLKLHTHACFLLFSVALECLQTNETYGREMVLDERTKQKYIGKMNP